MPKFNYVAMDAKGKEVTGTLESENQTTAYSRLREMGYFTTSIVEAGKDGGQPAVTAPAARAGTRKERAASGWRDAFRGYRNTQQGGGRGCDRRHAEIRDGARR